MILLSHLSQKITAPTAQRKTLHVSNKELVSIIVPCYNQALYIDDALQSVANQTYTQWECIIVDDGSPDRTGEIVQKWCARDSRFSYIQKQNGGVSSSRNVGIKAAKGAFILPLDGDDKMSDNYVEGCLKVFENRPNTRVVYGKAKFFGTQKGEWPLPDFEYDKLLTRNLIFCTAMFRKSDWERIGGYDEQMQHGLEDWDFWLRLIGKTDEVVREKSIVFYYRIKKSSRNTDLYNNQHFVDETYNYLYQKHYEKMKPVMGSPIQLFMEKEELEKKLARIESGIKDITVGDIIQKFKHAISKRLGYNEAESEAQANSVSMTTKGGSKLSSFKNKVKANIGNGNSLKEVGQSAVFYLSKKRVDHKIRNLIRLLARKIYVWIETKDVVILNGKEESLIYSKDPYAYWRSKHEVKEKEYDAIRKHIAIFNPRVFFTAVVYAEGISDEVKRSVLSLRNQLYSDWELVIIVPSEVICGQMKETLNVDSNNPQIKVVVLDTAEAMVQQRGSAHFVINIQSGDLLARDAFYWFAYQSCIDATAGLIYADEDMTDVAGRFYAPHFKPDWSPDNLMSYNYIQHAVVIRAGLLMGVDEWAMKLAQGAVYDIILQVSETAESIVHIPKVLYHAFEKIINEQQQQRIYDNNKHALEAAMNRRGEEGVISDSDVVSGVFIPRYALKAQPKVSIIIPTKDKIDILKTCIDSIVERSTYQSLEIVLIDNNSSTSAFFEQVKKWEQAMPEKFKCVRTEAPFNFAYLMNFGASYCSGDFYILLNNDTEVITPNWIELMMEQAQRSSIGVVGAKLLYPDNSIQHAGVVMGLSDLVDHVFVGVPRYGQTYQNYIHRVINYSALTAACLMVSKQKFDEVNGFNEQFQVEYNDIDFCLRLKEFGYNHVYLPHVELYHHESISRGHPFATPASYERHLREHALMKKTWRKYIDYDPCYNPNLSLKSRDMSVAF